MPYVDAQDTVELTRAEDQQPVQALGACGPYQALGVRVGLRRAKRRQDHLDTLGAEDFVEAGDALRVAVTDQEPDILERAGEAEVARLWVTDWPSGFVVAPARCTRRVCSSMKNST